MAVWKSSRGWSCLRALSVKIVTLFRHFCNTYRFGVYGKSLLPNSLTPGIKHIQGNPGVGHDLDETSSDHSILSKARARFGPALHEWSFGLIVRACRGAGPIDGNRLVLDATLIKANTSLDSLSSRQLHAQLPTAEDYHSQACAEGPVEVEGPRDPEEPPVPKGHTGAAAIARGGWRLLSRSSPNAVVHEG